MTPHNILDFGPILFWTKTAKITDGTPYHFLAEKKRISQILMKLIGNVYKGLSSLYQAPGAPWLTYFSEKGVFSGVAVEGLTDLITL